MPLDKSINLEEVFCMKENRVVQSGEIINYLGNKFVLKSFDGLSLVKEAIEIREYRNGKMKIFHRNKEVNFELFDRYISVAMAS
jgi:hypothetical protein